MNNYTDLLFARPSLLEGAARTLDMGSTFSQYNALPSPEQADFVALRSDWEAVGADLRQAMVRFVSQFELETEEVQQP